MAIPVFPGSGSGSTSGSTPKSSSGSGSGSTSGSGSGGSGGVDPYTAAIRAQKRAESKARHNAARRMLEDAKVLGEQAAALRKALGSEGFLQALNTGLANIAQAQATTDRTLLEGYTTRVKSLEQAAGDNEKAAAGQSVANLANRARERSNALSEAMSQGAGESDVLRAQQMSLRNWNANQNEVNRSFFDTLTSVNSSLRDLTTDTKTARINNALQAEDDRAQAYANYYDQRSQTYTQIGNVLGQQAADYSAALEQVKSKKTRRRLKRAQNASSNAFNNASELAGQAYASPGVDPALQAWSGVADFKGQMNPGDSLTAESVVDLGRPEGATLRRLP